MQSDVIILGGGLVGLTLALALDAHGLSATVVDPADPDAVLAPGFDGRASAIASASWNMLQAIGLGERLEGKGCPIASIRVSDGLKPGALDFEPGEGDDALGIMFENRLLRQTLHAAAAEAKHVTLLMPARPIGTERGDHGVMVRLADGRKLTAPLLIAAEGRNSPTRAAAGINVARWQYEHSAIIAAVEHEKPHGNIAYEIFYPTGPFAILPMLPGNRSALVWSVAKADAPGYLKLGPRGFTAELETKMGGLLGKLELLAPLATYPLGFHHAGRITDQRLALVGDAAHGIHPIAGQGLNLGLRDAAALTEVLVEGARLGLDLGDAQLLKRYERWRSLDTFLVAASTDGLARLFGIPGDAASAVRRFGLSAVQRIAPLKSFFMAEARGEYGDKPKLLSGLTV
ncbi:UbiH/UbiF/VisC/COQ6 family ubiquinone biosynthesis hydroxylase [Sphingomonas sp.]|jgi:2-octaprenyl-6-methoxyphenol hydroxylase|uniref:UbiH/UbiF/VisC/COQ6 family ubiquinone biosynthesis hydroxylase n=1 Tax=Sphingomonas sp. TaxID=28214 RepID=UPI002DBBAB92|nr:UbiH/UbiF/VisC/COQ6 family ubiquinone biosynthesis hydroxylase [Sphingomonas sp.]HEU4970221.1 UbiH/UbiF/VisC/COQ6 family ubiquinone biosynthesis hydroxylase [Sphingomonas sp.]